MDFEVECQKKKGRPKMTFKKQFAEDCESWFENGRCSLMTKWSVGINQIATGLK